MRKNALPWGVFLGLVGSSLTQTPLRLLGGALATIGGVLILLDVLGLIPAKRRAKKIA